MTTTYLSYDARRHRLHTAKAGATVTIPDGWTPPDEPLDLEDHQLRWALEPGDVLTNDGSGDALPWNHDAAGYVFSSDLALLVLDVDPAPGDEDDPDDSTGDTPPATTGCDSEHCEAVRNGDEPPRLDECQRERVAALEEALRVFESRRPREVTGTAKSIGDLFSTAGPSVVKLGDLVAVAAFIADGTLPGGDKA